MKTKAKNARRLRHFNDKFVISTTNSYKGTYCWDWIASTNADGYGMFQFSGKMIGAHQYSYLIFKGNITKELELCHNCNRRTCVNPDHLRADTHAANVLDAVKAGPYIKKGSENCFSKLTEQDVLNIRKDYATGSITLAALGKKFQVSFVAIGCIIRRETWVHI